jgi:MFS family permease
VLTTSGFRRYFASAVLSYAGDGLRMTAFPLLAVSLTSSPAQVAAVSAAATAPWLIFGLHAGAVADRVPRLRLMVALQVVRAAAGAIAVAGVLTDRLGIAGLAVVAVVLGTAEVYYDIASHAVLPELVPVDRLQWANSRLVAAEVATFEFAGPALGGVLFAVAAAMPIGIDAATFLGSAILLAGIRTPQPEPADRTAREPLRRDLAAGIRWFVRAPLIRSLTVLSAAINLGTGGMYAVLVVFAERHLGLGPAGYGVLIAVGAVGSFAGGLLAERIGTGTGRRLVVAGTAPLVAGCFALMALAPHVVAAGTSIVLFGLLASIFNVIAMSLRQARTPGEMLGRVVGVHRVLCWGAIPVGALAAGAVGSAFGLRWAIGACAAAIVVGWLASLPMLRHSPVADYA